MEEDKVVLDRKSFEALAVDTRVRILKSLKERRKTLSEIAKEQEMSVSGVKEHLATLESVGLIVKRDDGHKWKYYELTKKGADIVAPRELRVWILLSISFIALAASMTALLWPPVLETQEPAGMLATDAAAGAQMPKAAGDMQEADGTPAAYAAEEPSPMLAGRAQATASTEEPAMASPPEPDMTAPLAVAAVSAITLLACAGILAKNRLGAGRSGK